MQLHTHLKLDTSLCGKVIKLHDGYAEVLLHTTRQMSVDEQGLVHGGFIFGAADFAAMAVVNDPYVVLGSATSKFVAPVKIGDAVLCKATLLIEKGKNKIVEVHAYVSDKLVFEGSFTTFILERHVLD